MILFSVTLTTSFEPTFETLTLEKSPVALSSFSSSAADWPEKYDLIVVASTLLFPWTTNS